MNQPSSLKSLDHLDTSSDSSDSQSECESITIPDPNNPDTVQRFIDSTIPHREPKIEQVSIINSQDVHIGTRHSFHFHGVPLPSKPINEEPNGNADLETNTPWTNNTERAPSPVTPMKTKSVFRHRTVILALACLGVIVMVLVVLIPIAAIKAQTTKLEDKNVTEPSSDLVISRQLWQAADPLETLPDNDPARLVVLKHTGGPSCTDFQSCSARVREIQNEDMKQYPDIRYNFLVGGDNRIYEGRGWLVRNEGVRNESVDFAFIGNYSTDVPSSEMLSKTQYLVIRGASFSQNKINYLEYYVVAHNQTEPTDSPGANVFKWLKSFNHYESNAVCYDIESGVVKITEVCP